MTKPRLTGDYPRDITEASRSVLAEEALALAGYRDARGLGAILCRSLTYGSLAYGIRTESRPAE